jgi:ribokinase
VDDDTQIPLSTLRRLYDVSVQIGAGRSLRDTMRAVVDGVVSGLGFGVAVASLRHDDGTFEAIAVAGSDEARDTLVGRRMPPAHFQVEFDRADQWGKLLFVPHDRVGENDDLGWVPDIAIPTDPEAWHPLDALFAPLTSATGELIGVLSVDLPEDGQRPAPLLRELLELLAVQAGIAIDAARLAERLREDRTRLLASEKAFRLAFEGSRSGMAAVSVDEDSLGHYIRVNHAFLTILGSTEDAILGTSVVDYLDRVDPAVAAMVRNDPLTSFREPVRLETRALANGQPIWLSAVITSIDSGQDQEPFLLIQIDDVTDVKTEHQRLVHEARHDFLTGLPNRRLLVERLVKAHQRARESPGRRTALLYCDLNGFKPVNDRYGHAVGDRALQTIARRLLDQVRPTDLVARMGGDEFVMLVEDVDSEELSDLIRRVIAAVSAPLPEVDVPVTMSIGISHVDGTSDPNTILGDADSAMYEHKTKRRRLRADSSGLHSLARAADVRGSTSPDDDAIEIAASPGRHARPRAALAGLTVLGSANVDVVAVTSQRPAWGETTTGQAFFTSVGGKGLNQAVAAARAGGDVSLVAAVGRDSNADLVVDELAEAGVDVDALTRVAEPTGVAHITVGSDGRNAIIVVPGANGTLADLDVHQRSVLTRAKFVLAQLEIPVGTVVDGFRQAKKAGSVTMLTPAPVPQLSPATLDSLLEVTDILLVNEVEAAQLGADVLARVPIVVTTRGERGSTWTGPGDETYEIPALAVEAVDTTGAGDCFAGALAVGLEETGNPEWSLRFASAAAGLSVQTEGAATSMPRRAAIDAVMEAAERAASAPDVAADDGADDRDVAGA